MNKKIIVIAIMLVIMIVGLSGCISENDSFVDSNNIKLMDYEVVSYKFGDSPISPNKILGEGFNYKEDMVGFKVSGTFKNNEGEPLKKIKVIGNFYDGNNYLGTGTNIYDNVPDGETREFSVFFHESNFKDDNVNYLLFVDSVKFEFEIEKFN